MPVADVACTNLAAGCPSLPCSLRPLLPCSASTPIADYLTQADLSRAHLRSRPTTAARARSPDDVDYARQNTFSLLEERLRDPSLFVRKNAVLVLSHLILNDMMKVINHLRPEYLEDETDTFQGVDDWDVPCGELRGESLNLSQEVCGPFEMSDSLMELEERLKLQQEPLDHGPTIIYVPTRKETLIIAKFLCDFGIKAAAYNAKVSFCIINTLFN
ncbi:uncharacterized protein LOC104438665 [Eucalyptus grandis]|uniref:uncharacterized protein LOC104438665 n=1 Tax=Eucalyptus grandis TaxID=71139 RepID=UPI00192F1159|nr:uncharacterized protein LOC104438665 [Eucalyptus grandis]